MRVKKANTKSELISPEEKFKQLCEQYHVATPQALQLRLMWNHITWLIEMTMHPSPENKAMLQLHRHKFTIAEMQQCFLDTRKKKR